MVNAAVAEQSSGAILVSFWHQRGMPDDSGTPTDWLASLDAPVVNIHCACPPDVAAERFARRTRHAGHLDKDRSLADLRAQLGFLASLDAINFGRTISVPTTQPVDVDDLHRLVTAAWSAA